jgi:hypothetical protein
MRRFSIVSFAKLKLKIRLLKLDIQSLVNSGGLGLEITFLQS